MRRRPHRRAWHGRGALVATDNGRVALVATDNGRGALVATDNGRVELPLDRKRRGENGRAGARPSLPPTFLHFYTAKAIPHDGEAPSPQCRTTARRRRHYSDRMRGSLRSWDMSPRMGGRNKCDPPAFLPKSISKWPNAIVNRKSQIENP